MGKTEATGKISMVPRHILKSKNVILSVFIHCTRDVFYVRRKVDLMKTAKENAYIMHIFGKSELLSIHAT